MESELIQPVENENTHKASLGLGTILGRLLISFFAWSIHLVVTAALIVFFGSIVPYYIELFDRFGLDLPPMTESVIRLSLSVSNYWYLAVLAMMVINGPIAVGVCYLPVAWRWVAWGWFAGYLLFAILLLMYASMGLVMSIRDLLDLQEMPM